MRHLVEQRESYDLKIRSRIRYGENARSYKYTIRQSFPEKKRLEPAPPSKGTWTLHKAQV